VSTAPDQLPRQAPPETRACSSRAHTSILRLVRFTGWLRHPVLTGKAWHIQLRFLLLTHISHFQAHTSTLPLVLASSVLSSVSDRMHMSPSPSTKLYDHYAGPQSYPSPGPYRLTADIILGLACAEDTGPWPSRILLLANGHGLVSLKLAGWTAHHWRRVPGKV
jgi:hypothetical protein